MRLLADRNVPLALVRELRARGHDVAPEDDPEALDEDVLRRARRERRIVLTLDKDFGELVFLRRASPPGVILLRLRIPGPDGLVRAVTSALESHTDWEGSFSVVEERRIRSAPLPTRPG